MAKAKRSRLKRLVLDVGSSAVRLCELSHTKTGYQLTKYYHREFALDPSMDEDEQRKSRAETLRALLKDAKVRHKRTVLGVPGQSVFTRTRALPPVPEYKVTQIVKYEIQQQIPFSLDQIAFDYQVLQRTEAGGYDVLMAAIKVDVVEKRLDIVRDVKRRVDTVDVCPLAAYNWLKYTGEFGEDGDCIALIDLGAATTDIIVERDNQFRFTRSLNLGGNDITSAVAAEFGVSFAEAEKMKRERGFAPSGDAQRDGKGGEVIGRVLNRLVSEISRSFAYFRSQPGGGPVSRIIVTGGGACLRNMIPFLQRQLGIEVRIAQPLAGLAIAPGAQEVNEHPEQAAVALGLALRCRERVAIGVNLIPPRILEAAKRKEQAVYWGLSLLTLGLIVLSIVPSMAQRNGMVLEQIEFEKSSISRYDPRIINPNTSPQTWISLHEKELKQVKAEIASYQDVVGKLDDAYASFKPWIDYMIVVNDMRPRGKVVLLWSIESTWLEGSTGQTTTTSRRGRRRARDDEEDEDMGGFGSGLGGAQVGTGGISQSPIKWASSGFLGIASGALQNQIGRPGIGQGTSSRRADSQREPELPRPGWYNGLTIQGYADSVETIQAYVENLKKSGEFLDGAGVFWDDRFTDPVPPTVLDNAGGGAATQSYSSRGGMRDRKDDDDEDSGRGFNIGANPMSSPTRGGPAGTDATLWLNPSALYPFRIELQFMGEPADQQTPATAQTSTGSAPTGPGGVTLRLNREDD
jgi:type IV pilus assembly protein PilM